MAEWIYPDVPLTNSAAAMRAGKIVLDNARAIVKAGPRAALAYAQGWYEQRRPARWLRSSDADRRGMVARMAADIQECAELVVKDGRPWWFHEASDGETMLVIAWFNREEKRAFGYMPVMKVTLDAAGKIVLEEHYEGGERRDRSPMSADEFRAIRLRLDVTQEQMAGPLGYAKAVRISEFETGRRPVPIHLAMVMRAMDQTGWRPEGWPK